MFKSNSFDKYNTNSTKEELGDKQHHSTFNASTGNSSSSNNNNNQETNRASNTSSRKPPIKIAVPATTSKVPRNRSTPGRNFFKKLFRTPGKSASKKSRGGLVITPSNEGKLGFAVGSRALASASSEVLLSRSYSTGSRTDYSGAVISIEHSTSNSSETEGPSSAATQKRINSRIRQSFSLTSPTSNPSPTFNDSRDLGMSSNSPPVARRLLAEEDMNIPSAPSQSKMEKTEIKAVGTPQRQVVDEGLLAASESPERQNDMIFVSKSSSSSEADEGFREQRNDVSPEKRQQPPMRSRGISIPTPAISKHRNSECYKDDEESGIGIAFARPLRRVEDSPAVKTDFVQRLESEDGSNTMSKLGEVDEDDDAFLPDDFQKPSTSYSEEHFLQKVEQAKRTILEQANQEFEQKASELERAYNSSLMEHGLEWRREKEAERDRLTARLVEEKSKTSRQHEELLKQRQLLDEYKQKVDEYEQGSGDKTIVQDDTLIAQELYKNQLQEKITSMQEHLSELQNEQSRSNDMVSQLYTLQQAKDAAYRRIEELEQKLIDATKDSSSEDLNRQLLATKKELDEERSVVESNKEELVILKGEKSEVERQVIDLNERLRIRTESNNEALARLEAAEDEIKSLKSEISKLSDAEQKSTDELHEANAEIEKLRILQNEDKRALEMVRSQMERVDEQYRAVLYSPQKNTDENPPESPCSQVDILRIDNNKAHEQLKAMGKVLKRYKAERDEIKAKMVQTVEIAVKQAKGDMQEKLEISSEEIKKLVNEVEDLKKKLSEEIEKNAATEKAISRMEAQSNKEKDEMMDSNKKAVQKYESDISSATERLQEEMDKIKKRDMEYQELQKQMDRMQGLHNEEIELAQQEAREEAKIKLQNEIDVLQGKLTAAQSGKFDLEKKITEFETLLGEARAKIERDKLEGDRRLRDLQNHHRKEIDELTTELDLFEAENVENIRKLQESLKDKETVISAMGSQLAEAESRFSTSSDNQTLLQRRIEELQENLRKAQKEKIAKEEELADQLVLKEKAIEDVANELTAKAEKQFEERNELYRVLKKKFDEATSTISVLERDLRFAEKELDELKKRHEAREADLKDELAQAKAAIAKSDANLARAEKNHRAELQRSMEELDAAKATSEQVQKSLAIVVNEKKKLAAEVVDLKNISEELMAMVEEKGLA